MLSDNLDTKKKPLVGCNSFSNCNQIRACSSCNLTGDSDNEDVNDNNNSKSNDKCPQQTTQRFRQVDYYDVSLTGVNAEVDKRVELHKLETMAYNKGKYLI